MQHDDFWGDVPDWTDSHSFTERTGDDLDHAGRPAARSAGLGATVRGWWDRALNAGAAPTREHRVVDASSADATPTVAAADDPFHDLDLDHGWGDAPSFPTGRDQGWNEADEATVDIDDRSSGHPRPELAGLAVAADEISHDPADDDPWIDDAFEPVDARHRSGTGDAAPSGVDPLLARAGVVAVVITLLVPLVIGLRAGGDESTDTVAGAATEIAPADDAAPTVTLSEAPADIATDAATETPVGLDPADLPPAVPVERDEESQPSATPVATAASNLVGDETGDDSERSAVTTDGDAATGASDTDTGTDSTATSSERSPVASAATANAIADRDDQQCAAEHDVGAGDFWIGLAERADVTLAALLDANDATVETPLFPGATICLPADARTPLPAATTTTTTEPAPVAAPTTEATTTTTSTTTTTTSTTTTTTTTSTTVPAGPEEIERIIRDVWPDDLEDRALEIAFRESRYVPTAKNFCCYGLFQIYWEVHRSWLSADLGITEANQLYDPETNTRAALMLYERAGGWGPWGF